jgi:peptidyl-dipeptidase Dcp
MSYLQYDNVKRAIFHMANKLFNLSFERVNDVETWNDDVEVWLATRDSKKVGLIYIDPFARSGKTSGAWMDSLRLQKIFNGNSVLPLVTCNVNFSKGDSVLLSLDDAKTFLHEFGHVLHAILSKVTYRSLSGTNVVRDYVEFPSQFMERWLLSDEVIPFLLNKSGEVIPKDLISKIKSASTFNEGNNVVVYMICALADLEAHLTSDPIYPKKFIENIFEKYNINNSVN